MRELSRQRCKLLQLFQLFLLALQLNQILEARAFDYGLQQSVALVIGIGARRVRTRTHLEAGSHLRG